MGSVVFIAAALPIWMYNTTNSQFQQSIYSVEVFRVILISASTCRMHFFPQLLSMWTIAITFGAMSLQTAMMFRLVFCNFLAMLGCWTMQHQSVNNFVLREIQKYVSKN